MCRQGHYNNRMGSDSSIAEVSPTPGDESVGKNSPQISANSGNSNTFQVILKYENIKFRKYGFRAGKLSRSFHFNPFRSGARFYVS